MNYFYRDSQNREIGPLPLSALRQLRQSGLLSDDTQMRGETGTTWSEYRKVISTSAMSAQSAPGVAVPALLPGHDRMARAKQFSWSFFAFATLCFFLPFIAVSRQPQNYVLTGQIMATGGEVEAINSVTGKPETKTVSAEPIISSALGFTLVALILAIPRKPFLSLLSGLSGIGGVAGLLCLQSIVEQTIAAKNEELHTLTMRVGFWLACALLTGGAVVQFILFQEARINGGWKLRARHYLAFAGMTAAVVIFLAGPVIFDVMSNTTPGQSDLLQSITSRMPTVYARFSFVKADYKFDQTGDKVSGTANVTFTLKEPLYVADDFIKRATEKGDDQQAYAAALVERNTLPTSLAPNVPGGLTPQLYSVAKAAGSLISLEITFKATKVPRNWSFGDFINVWKGRRAWNIESDNWPAFPHEFDGLLAQSAFAPRGGLVIDADATNAALQSYVESRRAFIAAVNEAKANYNKQAADADTLRVKQLTENMLTDAARAEVSKRLRPANAYTISTVKIDPSDAIQTSDISRVIDVSIEIVQNVDLLRVAKEQPPQWDEFQHGSAFDGAKLLAGKISAKAILPKPLDPVVYEFVSSPHSTTTKLQIEFTGPVNASVVQRVSWPDSANFTDETLVSSKGISGNALLTSARPADPTIPTVQEYRSQIQAFILAVGEEQKLKIAQRFEAYFVKQQPNDPHFDKLSYQDDPYFPVESRQYTNSYDSIWNAIAKVLANNHSSTLTSDKTFGEISNQFGGSLAGFMQHLQKYRLRILLTNTENGVKVDVKAYLYIAWTSESNRLSKDEVVRLYANREMKIGTVYLTDPQFRDYDEGGYWSMYPDTEKSKQQGLLFLDQLATELNKSP